MRRVSTSPAMVVAGIALVAATSTGTALAATGQLVNIADGSNAGNLAKVSPAGELKVSGRVTPVPVATTVQYQAYFSVGYTFAVFGPTNATLAIDHLDIRNPAANSAYANTDLSVHLVRLPVAEGSCATGGAAVVSSYGARVGQYQSVDYSTPLQFKPSGAPYCIGLILSGDPTNPSAYYLPQVSIKGSVLSGTYTGPGVGLAAGSPPLRAPLQEAGAARPEAAARPLR